MAEEIQILAQKALKSPALKNAILLRRLLQLLAGQRGKPVPALVIWDEVFVEDKDPDPDWRRVREVASRARAVLKEIAEASGADRFLDISDAGKRDEHGRSGYRLVIKDKGKGSPTEEFWFVHAHAENVKLIYPEPVFYYDIGHLCFFRFFDTNPDTTSIEDAVPELEKLHGKELQGFIDKPLEKRLRPSRIYVGIGEMEAMDALTLWFSINAALPVQREASNRGGSLVGSSPVLLGSDRTNLAIKRFWRSKDAQKFAFRLHPERFGFVSIRKAKTEERCEFEGFELEADGESINVGQNASISQVRERLVVVTRSQSPGGKGWTTIISSDTTLALREVALTLVNDQRLGGILGRTTWGEGALPEAFEMLFSVEVAPSGEEHETGIAKLRCFRSYKGLSSHAI